MEQIAVSFTKDGAPKTGLKPTVTIMGRDGSVFIDGGECQELGHGWYIYNFDNYNAEKVYLYVFDGGSELDDYDRYKFGGNEFDAYTNKYSWGRTAAPYFTSINGRFDKVDKSIKDAMKKRKEYDDTALRKDVSEIKNIVNGKGGYDLADKLIELRRMIETVSKSIKKESSTKGVSDINEKLNIMAEYVVKLKEDVDAGLNNVGEAVTQSIQESNANLNEGMSSKVTIDQLLQQVERLENRMNDVLDTFVRTQMEGILPKDITDRYDVNLSKKNPITEEQVMQALDINQGMNQGMETGMSEGLGEERPAITDAPVDMQGIAEPIMPNGAL